MATRTIIGDALETLKTLPNESVHTCVTSPPYYGLRDYGMDGQIGAEPTPDEFIARLVAVFREVRRVLRSDGTCWVNMGDSYAGSGKGQTSTGCADRKNKKTLGMAVKPQTAVEIGLKPKDLIGIPWMLAFALRADGWWLRQDIIWSKPNPMPESVTDRCTKAHEYIFLLSKSPKYYYDSKAVAEPAKNWGTRDRSNSRGGTKDPKLKHHGLAGRESVDNPTRNKRSVWEVVPKPFRGAHFATFPPALIEPCILAGCPQGGTVLDPFFGAGTTGLVANRLQRDCIGIELNPDYALMAYNRIELGSVNNGT